MTRSFTTVAAGLCLAAAVHAAPHATRAPRMPMTAAAYAAGKQKIATEYQADQKTCSTVKGNLREVCDAQAKGRKDAALAELEAHYQPSPERELKAKTVTADANYEVARAKCAGLQGAAKDRCGKQAKLAREAAIRQAKVEKVQETGGLFGHAAQQHRAALDGRS